MFSSFEISAQFTNPPIRAQPESPWHPIRNGDLLLLRRRRSCIKTLEIELPKLIWRHDAMQSQQTYLEPIDEAFARLSMLEFMLEVVMANQLVLVSPENSKQAKADLLRVSAKAYGPITGDLDEAQKMRAMVERGAQMAQRFVDKVERREAEIRSVMGQMGPGFN